MELRTSNKKHFLIQDLCVKKTFLQAPSCDDCVERAYGSTMFMGDEEIQVQLISAFMEGGFCEQFGEDAALCATALELVIPAALNMFAAYDSQWAVDFCTSQMQCM